jgi:hypothetical protein
LGSRARADLVRDDKVSPTLSCPGPTGATFTPPPILLLLALSLECVGTVFEEKITSLLRSSSSRVIRDFGVGGLYSIGDSSPI